ncbi:MAG: hypothetical protein U0T83_02735 [Bacteriovoracaceae bacterium]
MNIAVKDNKKLPLKWINILFVTSAPILGVLLTILHLSQEGFSWSIFSLRFFSII